jgi:hypothetical protein
MLINKFKTIKQYNTRLQKFIQDFMRNEYEFSEKLKSLKVNKATKKIENKRIIPQQVISVAKEKIVTRSNSADKKNKNVSCSMIPFLNSLSNTKSKKALEPVKT